MPDEHPYRAVAAPELSAAWETHAQALEGMEALITILRGAGVTLDPLMLELSLRPRVLAFLDADAEASVYVAWEIVREANRFLAAAGVEARFHRAGERSPRFLLLSPTELGARRAAGETMLARPPPIGPGLPALLHAGGALLGLGVVVGALLSAGAYLALAGTAVALVIATLVSRAIAKRDRPWRGARFLTDAPLAIPLVALLHRGELLLLGLVVAALVLSALAQRWRA